MIEAIVRASSFRAVKRDTLFVGTLEANINFTAAVVVQSGEGYIAYDTPGSTVHSRRYDAFVGSVEMTPPAGILAVIGNNLGGIP